MAPFLCASDAIAVELGWIFFKKSNVKRFDDDCADAFDLQPFDALLNISSKLSISLGSFVVKSSKSKMVESFTLAIGSPVAFSIG